MASAKMMIKPINAADLRSSASRSPSPELLLIWYGTKIATRQA